MKNVLIQASPGTWLDGKNMEWETTTDRKTAWRMTRQEAERRLPLVRAQFPSAHIATI